MVRRWGGYNFDNVQVHPYHVIESIKVTLKPRPGHRRTYLIIGMFTMLMNMMPYVGEGAFQFSYVKRLFGWAISEYSWYNTTCSLLSAFAMMVFFPIFHKFNVTDNSVIIVSCISQVSFHQWNDSQIGAACLRGLATQPWHFYASAGVDMGTALVSPPIRAQLSQCVEPHEVGKVRAFNLASSMYTRCLPCLLVWSP